MIRVATLVLVALATIACAQPVRYVVDLSRAQTQSIDIAMTIPGLDRDEVEVALPVWRPGRYAVLDLAQSVSRVRAEDSAGNPLDIEKVTKTSWKIDTAGSSEITVRYRVYANQLSLRTRHVDDTHAFLSGSAVFMFTHEERARPVRVTLANMPQGWQIASGMDFAPGSSDTLVAADYDTLVDSPIEAGIQRRIDFTVLGKPHQIVIWGQGEWDMQQLADDFTLITEHQAEIFGGLPYERYVFMIHAQPGSGGGTEHINSTIMGADPRTATDDGRYRRFLGLVSHEMFHTWNVKSFRPLGITPYNYLAENYTDLLWVAEGTTSYYDDLTLARTGLISVSEYLGRLSGAIRGMRDRPGRHVQDLAESSHDAWIKLFKTDEDSVNQSVNFYRKGSLASLLLDLEIRRLSRDAGTLDGAMRRMYERYPLRLGGYTSEQFKAVCEEVAGAPLDEFFARYIEGTDPLPLEEALLFVGLRLARDADPGDPDEPYLGLQLSGSSVSTVLDDGPAREAGIIFGDEIIAVNGTRLAGRGLDAFVADHKPGDTLRITLFRYDRLREIDVVLTGRPAGSWRVGKLDDPTPEQQQRFTAWLQQAW